MLLKLAEYNLRRAADALTGRGRDAGSAGRRAEGALRPSRRPREAPKAPDGAGSGSDPLFKCLLSGERVAAFQAVTDALSYLWVPAFAGMTAGWKKGAPGIHLSLGGGGASTYSPPAPSSGA